MSLFIYIVPSPIYMVQSSNIKLHNFFLDVYTSNYACYNLVMYISQSSYLFAKEIKSLI